MFKKPYIKDFPLKIFVIASILILAIFVFVFFVMLAYFKNNGEESVNKNLVNGELANVENFLNNEYEHKDPYTTKIPNLKDMLKGPIISTADPSLGNINSTVTIVLFSDFECDYCAKQEKLVKEMMAKYDLRLIWKDYPSNDQTSRSYQAAVAARCAQSENAFWNFHDMLYSGEYSLDKDGFSKIAGKLNLDMDEFSDCLDKMTSAGLVNDNMLEAEALDIGGVPFMYVNNQEVLGEIGKKDLEKLIEIEL